MNLKGQPASHRPACDPIGFVSRTHKPPGSNARPPTAVDPSPPPLLNTHVELVAYTVCETERCLVCGSLMAKHGRGSGSGANPAGRAPMSDTKTPAVAQPAKRRRGAPQTFSSKLYKILQDAQHKEGSPVGWCLEGELGSASLLCACLLSSRASMCGIALHTPVSFVGFFFWLASPGSIGLFPCSLSLCLSLSLLPLRRHLPPPPPVAPTAPAASCAHPCPLRCSASGTFLALWAGSTSAALLSTLPQQMSLRLRFVRIKTGVCLWYHSLRCSLHEMPKKRDGCSC